jgi:hypothetical protein
MIDLGAHYIAGVRRFLQTAIVIDDQAEFTTPPPTAVGPVLRAPTGSLLRYAKGAAATERMEMAGAEVAVDACPAAPLPTASEPAQGAPAAAAVEVEVPEEHGVLNAKALSEAFLSKNMICGLYRPSPGEDMVSRTTGAAKLADIVIVDWFLDQRGSRAAKDIILSLLKSDATENGRLRLVAVYTSQPGRAEMAGDLLREIEAEPVLKGRLRADGPALVGTDTRIIFLNKRGSFASQDREEVSEADLPERLVTEFAHLSDGLLATFAISAVAAVRRGAHHVLALYGEELDGAYIGHRCALPHPDDAITFAADLISTELRNLIELDDTAERNLNKDVVNAWLERLVGTGHTFRTDRAEVPVAEVRKFIGGGSTAVKKSEKKHHAHGSQQTAVDEKDRVSVGALARLFYSTADDAKRSTRLLSRLATFQRERIGRARLPDAWRPTLTLGTLIQAMPPNGDPMLLLCMQPRCDSVRLNKVFAFPFQTINVNGNDFNIALRDFSEVDLEAWVNLKPRDSRMLSFSPDQTTQTVRAQRENDILTFSDADGGKYAWLGDLKDMKAQKWASDLGGRVLGVGLDDFEWLRIAAERRLGKNWT